METETTPVHERPADAERPVPRERSAAPGGPLEGAEGAADAVPADVVPATGDPQPAAGKDLQRQPASERLQSLDAFRGLTIFGMLLVNNVSVGGATPRQLMHAAWNGGVHLADLVFPWFLLIVGIAIPFAAASRKRRGLPLWSYYLKALGRAATLVFLGCLIDSSLARHPLFDLGVLQLIGLAYFVGALLYELPSAARLAVAALLLIGHGWAIQHLSVGSFPPGRFTESDNLIVHVNQLYLQRYHLNGLVSVVPTAALVLIGAAVGDLLRHPGAATRKLGVLFGGGWVLLLAGIVWSHSLPFNKPVWTPSYILFSAGCGAIILTLFYAVMDVARWRAWAYPLLVFGSNAIVAYVAPILVKIHALREWTWSMPGGMEKPLEQAFLQMSVDRWGRVPGGWIYTLGYIAVWWLVLWVLYRRRLFFRV